MPLSLESFLSLPLEQQIGQFFYIGLAGTELDAETRALIEEIQPGGVIIFGRNVASPRQLRNLLDGVRELLPTPPLLGVDQEGGLVDRLRKISTPMPSARTIREHGDLAGARALGRITGEALRLLGFNMNFAPVMSIMTDERDLLSNGLYSRSFGRSPGEVLGYTTVYLRGLQETGIVGCLKHFPGIGAGEVDSHEQMPMVNLTHDDLMAQDLAPYIELFQRKDDRVRCVMVSHGGFPNIDITKGVTGGLLEPASLSHNIVTNLLRGELGYQHLVVTDDLEMGAIAKYCEIESAVVRAFVAGNDMMLICARPDIIRRGYHSLLGVARDGKLPRDRMRSSLKQISAIKSIVKSPPAFDNEKFKILSEETATLNTKLNYKYGGSIG
ncbi:MAG TPA: glycoside hydrolase family 3 N-terminal domain-containing protein [Pyrinomonadaceae bacterium]|jgi:beta-N-acetylhexosaminidase|nr:glycoside hydrolase family 3 N-terminal domain-containing protein [Pyrinomonadaceae bacterium]